MAAEENIHYLNDEDRTFPTRSESIHDPEVTQNSEVQFGSHMNKTDETDQTQKSFVTETYSNHNLLADTKPTTELGKGDTENKEDHTAAADDLNKRSKEKSGPLNLTDEDELKTEIDEICNQADIISRKAKLLTEPDEVYKHKHKIGLRKASESVITYNEPMYHCFVDSSYDKSKQSVVKQKQAESKRSRSLGNSPVKSAKVDFQRSVSFETTAKVMKTIQETDFLSSSFDSCEQESEQNKGKPEVKKSTSSDDKAVSDSKEAKKRKQAKLQREVAAKLKDTEEKLVKKLSPKQENATKNIKSAANKKIKERAPKNKAPIAQGRTKREASLNAVTFMNILYEKDDVNSTLPTKQASKRSRSESDVQVVAKKRRTSYTPSSLNSIEETIKEVVDRIRAEETINEVVQRIRSEGSTKTYAETKRNKSLERRARQKSDDKIQRDDVFQIDKFDLIKIKADKAKSRKPTKTNSSPTIKLAKKMGSKEANSHEDIAEKKRKANLARLKKAKEILQQGNIKKLKKSGKKDEKEFMNMKLAKLSAVLKAQNKNIVKGKSTQGSTAKKDKENNVKERVKLVKLKKTGKESEEQNKTQSDADTCRAARTHTENPKRVIRPSSCSCCQTYYQNQGSGYWNSRGSYNQEPCPGSSTDLVSNSTVEIHPYSSPTHVQMVDPNPFVGQLVPTHGHIPPCNSCTCVHGAVMSTPCPQCPVGGIQMVACHHHQGYSSAYPVSFPHNHGPYSHCGCTYCSSGSYHAPPNPVIHQPIADTSYLLHHPMSLQLPHESGHSLSLQLSHGEGSRVSHPIPHQVSHGENTPLHLSHMCNISHTEVTNNASFTELANNTSVNSEQDFIDVGEENYIGDSESKKSSADLMNGTILSEIRKSDNKSSVSKGDIAKLSNIKPKSIKVKPKGDKKDKDKSKLSDNLKVKRKKSDDSVSISDKVKKKSVRKVKKEKAQEVKKKERKKSGGGNKEKIQKTVSQHGWTWEGEPEMRTVTSIFDGKQIQRKCYKAIRHDDGDVIQTRDCILVCSGSQTGDNPYVAKVTYFWEEATSGEMMMSLLWYYRPEHTEGGRQPQYKDCEVFAAKHRDESPVACIDDKCYVLTYNEYCRFMAEVARTKYDLPSRKKLVPDQEEPYPSQRIPPVTLDPENILLCRNVYDFKLKRVLKNPS